MECWVDLGGWLQYIPKWFNPLPAHKRSPIQLPSNNRARRRVTTLIETNALPLSQATTVCDVGVLFCSFSYAWSTKIQSVAYLLRDSDICTDPVVLYTALTLSHFSLQLPKRFCWIKVRCHSSPTPRRRIRVFKVRAVTSLRTTNQSISDGWRSFDDTDVPRLGLSFVSVVASSDNRCPSPPRNANRRPTDHHQRRRRRRGFSRVWRQSMLPADRQQPSSDDIYHATRNEITRTISEERERERERILFTKFEKEQITLNIIDNNRRQMSVNEHNRPQYNKTMDRQKRTAL